MERNKAIKHQTAMLPEKPTLDKELPKKIKALGLELFQVNQLMAYAKNATEIQRWAESIDELMPEVSPGHVKFVIDLMKLGKIAFDPQLGVQNIIIPLGDTERFYNTVIAENDFRNRRHQFVLEQGAEGMLKYLMNRYRKILTKSEYQNFTAMYTRRIEAKAANGMVDGSGNYKRFNSIDKENFDFINGHRFVGERLQIFKKLLIVYNHPSVKIEDLNYLEGAIPFQTIKELLKFDARIVDPVKAWLKGKKTAVDLIFE